MLIFYVIIIFHFTFARQNDKVHVQKAEVIRMNSEEICDTTGDVIVH